MGRAFDRLVFDEGTQNEPRQLLCARSFLLSASSTAPRHQSLCINEREKKIAAPPFLPRASPDAERPQVGGARAPVKERRRVDGLWLRLLLFRALAAGGG